MLTIQLIAGDRNVSLSINPPLLLSEDVKFEFSTRQKFGEQLWGHNSKIKFARGEKVFHFWLNTFFVDMELEGGLAHDLTASNSIEAGKGHVHHASGSSEDSSTDDVPLQRPQMTSEMKTTSAASNGVKFASTTVSTDEATEVTNLVKHASISDDHLLQDRKTRQVIFGNFETFFQMFLEHSQTVSIYFGRFETFEMYLYDTYLGQFWTIQDILELARITFSLIFCGILRHLMTKMF